MRARQAAAALAAAALVLGACGGDDEPETTTQATATATSTSTASTTTTIATTSAEGAPVEELVASAADVEPDEVECGDEGGLESVIGSAGTCSADGREYAVADYGEDLELDTLTARIDEIEEAGKVRGDYLKPRRSKNGVFVVATLSVTNERDRPEVFDDIGEQVTLETAEGTYREPFDVLNGVATDSFLWQAKRIKPDRTVSGEVVFDVPEAAAEELDGDAAIQVLNFGAEGNVQRSDQIGLLRTGR